MYPINEFPLIPLRCLPTTVEGIGKFYNSINPDSCSILCEDTACPGFINKILLSYDRRKDRISARCRVCRKSVKCIPGKHLPSIVVRFY